MTHFGLCKIKSLTGQTRNTPSTPIIAATTKPIIKPCRGDLLEECTDEQLIEWAKPLAANVVAIEDEYMKNLKALDEIKSSNWFREFVGIGDQNSKWLKGYTAAQETATNRFRDCCVENTLAFHKVLVQRIGGEENRSAYEWAEDVTKPTTSREFKKAKQSAGKIIDIAYDLKTAEARLRIMEITQRKP